MFAKTVFPGFFGHDYDNLLFLLQGRMKTHSEYISAKQPQHQFFSIFLQKKNVFSLKKFLGGISKVTPSKCIKKHSDNIETLKNCMLSSYLKERNFFKFIVCTKFLLFYK